MCTENKPNEPIDCLIIAAAYTQCIYMLSVCLSLQCVADIFSPCALLHSMQSKFSPLCRCRRKLISARRAELSFFSARSRSPMLVFAFFEVRDRCTDTFKTIFVAIFGPQPRIPLYPTQVAQLLLAAFLAL